MQKKQPLKKHSSKLQEVTMINLVKNELFKIFHKKSTYIVLGIIFLFMILINYIYSSDAGYDNAAGVQEVYSSIDNLEDADKVYVKTDKKINELLNKYDEKSVQYYLAANMLYDYVYNYYDAYYINKDNLKSAKKAYESAMQALDNNNWKYFAEEKLTEEKENTQNIEAMLLDKTLSQREKNSLEEELFISKESIKWLSFRIDNNIAYKYDYLNEAYDAVISNLTFLARSKYKNFDESEKEAVDNGLKAYYENEYILKNKVDTNKSDTLRYGIINFYNDYIFLILVFVIMISGSIMSEEFNKGTVKSLLITPHTRKSILLSKLITIMLMIIFGILITFVFELIIGGIFFGFDSLSVPVVNYDLGKNSLSVLNIFPYFLLITICKVPYILLSSLLAFSLSTILCNTAFSIAITFFGLITESIINALALDYKIKFLNYFITTNWNLSYFLFGGTSPYNISLFQSIITCLIYALIMIIISLYIFTRKNIKNI